MVSFHGYQDIKVCQLQLQSSVQLQYHKTTLDKNLMLARAHLTSPTEAIPLLLVYYMLLNVVKSRKSFFTFERK